jgi:hypothetical protein
MGAADAALSFFGNSERAGGAGSKGFRPDQAGWPTYTSALQTSDGFATSLFGGSATGEDDGAGDAHVLVAKIKAKYRSVDVESTSQRTAHPRRMATCSFSAWR